MNETETLDTHTEQTDSEQKRLHEHRGRILHAYLSISAFFLSFCVAFIAIHTLFLFLYSAPGNWVDNVTSILGGIVFAYATKQYFHLTLQAQNVALERMRQMVGLWISFVGLYFAGWVFIDLLQQIIVSNIFPSVHVPFKLVLFVWVIVSLLLGTLNARFYIRHSSFARASDTQDPARAFGGLWASCLYGAVAISSATLFILSFTPSVLGLFYPDAPAPHVNDLQSYFVGSMHGNGALALLKAASLVSTTTTSNDQAVQGMLSGRSLNDTLASQLIAKNAMALQAFASSSAKQYIVTEMPPNVAVSSNLASNVEAVSSINELAALLRAKNAHATSSISLALRGTHVGSMITSGDNGLIWWLAGIEMENQSFATMQLITSSSAQTPQTLITAAQKLTAYETVSGLGDVIKLHFDKEFRVVRSVATQGLPQNAFQAYAGGSNNFYFRPNKTVSYFAEEARNNLAVASASCAQAVYKPLSIQAPKSAFVFFFTPNAVGKLLFNIQSNNFVSPLKGLACKTEVQAGATELLLALKAYELTHNGTLPATLNALVPTYLHTLPTDPFSGKSFEYNPHARTISSVGRNVAGLGPQWQGLAHPTFHI